MSEVVRIGGILIFHLNNLRKAKFFILCDVLFLVRLQEKFDIDHSGSERANHSLGIAAWLIYGKVFSPFTDGSVASHDRLFYVDGVIPHTT